MFYISNCVLFFNKLRNVCMTTIKRRSVLLNLGFQFMYAS